MYYAQPESRRLLVRPGVPGCASARHYAPTRLERQCERKRAGSGRLLRPAAAADRRMMDACGLQFEEAEAPWTADTILIGFAAVDRRRAGDRHRRAAVHFVEFRCRSAGGRRSSVASQAGGDVRRVPSSSLINRTGHRSIGQRSCIWWRRLCGRDRGLNEPCVARRLDAGSRQTAVCPARAFQSAVRQGTGGTPSWRVIWLFS